MISWEEYIKRNILEFRERYKKLPSEQREFIEKNEAFLLQTLNKPCQIVIFNFNKPYPVCFVVLHNKEHEDMKTIAHENVAPKDLSLKTLKRVDLLKDLKDSEIQKIAGLMEKVNLDKCPPKLWEPFKEFSLVWFTEDPRLEEPLGRPLCEYMYIMTRINISDAFGRKEIKETVEDIKKDASAIEETALRTRIIEKTEKLESQVSQLGEQHKKLREEVVGVRKLIGATKEFQEFRAFTTELEELKTTHIHREVFSTEVKRLDEKIEKGLGALNTRIEDLKAIKFWSKRTLLEIALAILATITTLFATGILKF